MRKIFLAFFLLLFFALPNYSFVRAAVCSGGQIVPCGDLEYGEPPCQLCHFFVMIGNIIDFLLFCIVPPLAVLMVAIGGIYMMVFYLGYSGPEGINRAKSLFKAIIIGLVVVYGAWLIVDVFFATIGVKSMFANWNTANIDCP